MRVFSFAPEVGRHIDGFGSNFSISRLAHLDGLHIGCMWLPAGGLVGYHPAATYQLFTVVEGEGWVRGEDEERASIHSGEAALWSPGEGHAAGTDTGMTVIVVETDLLGENLDAIGPIASH